jgi:hypothetical protein
LRALRRGLGWLVALVILFEEWGWEPLQALLARIGRLPPLAWLERRIAALPPGPALVVFAAPGLALLPLKLAALALVARGHVGLGLLLVVGAKLVGTAVVARLFALTRPALLRLAWFERVYVRWVAWKGALMAQVRASVVWRQARAARTRVLRWLRAAR